MDVTGISGVTMQIDGSGRVHLVQSMPVLRPDEQVLQLMLDVWQRVGRLVQVKPQRSIAEPPAAWRL